jgi:hypothetical protein
MGMRRPFAMRASRRSMRKMMSMGVGSLGVAAGQHGIVSHGDRSPAGAACRRVPGTASIWAIHRREHPGDPSAASIPGILG